MRDILALEAARSRTLEEVVALLEDRTLDAFTSDGVDDQLVIASQRAVSVIVALTASASYELLVLSAAEALNALTGVLI